jgi:hypothetical protein
MRIFDRLTATLYGLHGVFAGTLILFVALVLLAIFTTGCGSPTEVKDECIYRADLEKWVGPGCNTEGGDDND